MFQHGQRIEGLGYVPPDNGGGGGGGGSFPPSPVVAINVAVGGIARSGGGRNIRRSLWNRCLDPKSIQSHAIDNPERHMAHVPLSSPLRRRTPSTTIATRKVNAENRIVDLATLLLLLITEDKEGNNVAVATPPPTRGFGMMTEDIGIQGAPISFSLSIALSLSLLAFYLF